MIFGVAVFAVLGAIVVYRLKRLKDRIKHDLMRKEAADVK